MDGSCTLQTQEVGEWEGTVPGSTMRDSYSARSLRIVRIMMTATMQAMTSTTMHEFRMLNQCTYRTAKSRVSKQISLTTHTSASLSLSL